MPDKSHEKAPEACGNRLRCSHKMCCSAVTIRCSPAASVAWRSIFTSSLPAAPATLRWRMPTGVGPQFAANRGIGNHEANGIGDFLRLDQPAKLCERQDVLLQEL